MPADIGFLPFKIRPGLWVAALVLLTGVSACNLSTDETPPITPAPTLTAPPAPAGTPSPLPVLPTPTPAPVLPPTEVLAPTAVAAVEEPAVPVPHGSPEPIAIAALVEQVEAERLMTTIERLVGLGNRHVLSVPAPGAGIHAARHALFGELFAIQQAHAARPIDVYAQDFHFPFGDQEITATNVVMVIHGAVPDAGAVLVGAHYDTTGRDLTAHDTFQPGADDNASGVAAVLEIARIAAQSPHPATIICALFSAEEQGRFGSLAFVRDIVQGQGLDLRAAINLDMIGSPGGANGERLEILRVYSAPDPDSPSRRLAELVEGAARAYVPGLEIQVYGLLDRPGRWGDQQSFSDAGYPAVRLVEPYDHADRVHNERDTVDHIDADYLRRVTQAALAALLMLADSESANL